MSGGVKLVIERALARAADELSGVRLRDLRPDQNFFGGDGAIFDSLSLVSFIFILEEEILAVTGKKVKVSTNDILSREQAPFRNLISLETWLSRKIGEAK